MITSVNITGVRKIDAVLSNLPDALQYKVMISAMRKAARPMVQEMRRLSPEGDGGPRQYRGSLHIPGTLKKSHGIVNGKNKDYPTIYVGPRAGKKYKYDGFYFKFLIEGSDTLASHIKNPKKNWIKQAGDSKKDQAERSIKIELARALDRKMQSIIRRHGGGKTRIAS